MRRAPWITGVLTLATLVVAALLTTPWHLLPSAGAVKANGHLDFTAAEFAREQAFHHLSRPPSYLALLLSTLVAALLGFTPFGARIINFVSGGRWWWGVIAGGGICVVLPRLAELPADIRIVRLERDYGLTLESWSNWFSDWLRSLGVSLVLTLLMLLLLVLLARKWQQRWWVIAATGAGLLTVVVSFLYPVVIEPLYNNFHPLQAGPLRDSLLQLAAQDHLTITNIEVSDASKQTTTENAYVSGFGSSRHVVLYDTLLAKATPEEIRLVVAHEFGHVKHHDVARGTILGALGAVAGVSLLAGALGSGWLRSRAGFSAASDPRCVAAVLALASIVTTVTTPAVNVVSRQIEAHADLHALKLTHDPLTFIQVERNLALSNISSLGGNHISYALFATHPSSPDRIAMARTWAAQHGQPVPAPLVPQP